MKWKAISIGATRIKDGFLFMPRLINGEWRWLEFAVWVQEYVSQPFAFPIWEDKEWL